MKKTTLFQWSLLCFFALLAGALQAQNYTVSGYLTDSATGEALIGASVYDAQSEQGTVTNHYGFYSITIPSGNKVLRFSYVGYATRNRSFFLGADLSLNVQLPAALNLKTVVVKSEKNDQLLTGKIDLPIDNVKKLPAILGEVDLIKAIQLLPGVKSGNEGGSGMYVRGGSPDQNLILLDGVPVYNVSHLFGFFSVFNSEAINNVQLYKGGFPARFGGRLSSVLDITMKEGNNKKLSGNFFISPIAGSASLNGPLGKSGKTTFAISGRRTFLDLLLTPLMDESTGVFSYFFYDFNAKISHKISDKDRVFFSIYTGKDKLFTRFKDTFTNGNTRTSETFSTSLDWGNVTTMVRWNRLVNKKLFSNYTLSYTRYRLNIKNELSYEQRTDTSITKFDYLLHYRSGIRDIALKADYEYAHSTKHFIRFGGISTLHGFSPGAMNLELSQTGGQNLDTLFGPAKKILSLETAFYIEDEVRLSKSSKANAGLRLVHYLVNNKNFVFAEPRITVNKRFKDDWVAKISYARMNQFLHLLTNSGTALPTDLWVPATDIIRPQTSHQIAVGLTKPVAQSLDLVVEGYYKWMNNLIDYQEGADFSLVNTDWESKVSAGKGWAYGAEVLLQKKEGKLTGWFGYTLSWAERQIDGINNDKKYFFKYDRRHDFALVAIYELDKQRTVSMNFVFATGSALTMPAGKYRDLYGNTIFEYGEKNGYRMRNYHRLDLSYNKTKTKRKDGAMHYYTISIYNVYSRMNPFYVYIDNTATKPVVKQVSLFGFLPSIAYGIKF